MATKVEDCWYGLDLEKRCRENCKQFPHGAEDLDGMSDRKLKKLSCWSYRFPMSQVKRQACSSPIASSFDSDRIDSYSCLKQLGMKLNRSENES
ncbi:hypothetical protein WISP_29227 [Willisornis vidua]|uniref:Uncharacterized protein n=1 Tax=Willisornis vidua TaxID=1566151 RepID=A0ABQ9DKQ7_9PASS|nr:hypothetical protein WISP_29227 [Willisornis vidua]